MNVDLIVDGDEGKRTSIYLGPREKIDPSFYNCLQHRSLFLAMRRLAAINHDSRQLTVLDRQLERIEYFLNKGQDAPSVLDYRVWIRVLAGSSSVCVAALVVGFLQILAAPACDARWWISAHQRSATGFCCRVFQRFPLAPTDAATSYRTGYLRGQFGTNRRQGVRHRICLRQNDLEACGDG